MIISRQLGATAGVATGAITCPRKGILVAVQMSVGGSPTTTGINAPLYCSMGLTAATPVTDDAQDVLAAIFGYMVAGSTAQQSELSESIYVPLGIPIAQGKQVFIYLNAASGCTAVAFYSIRVE